MSESEQLFEQHIFHHYDHQRSKAHLDGLYGRVALAQNMDIATQIVGKRVLDVGAGYGTLTHYLRSQGFDAVGIEPNKQKIACAKEWYGVDLEPVDIYETPFAVNDFDTVILREVVFHLDLPRALQEIRRIGKSRLVIFQGNSIFLRRFGQWVYNHKEYNEKPRSYYLQTLVEHGFKVTKTLYRDCIAFPLSGGLIGRPLVPYHPKLATAIVGLDRWLHRLIATIKLEPFCCYRFIISAQIEDATKGNAL